MIRTNIFWSVMMFFIVLTVIIIIKSPQSSKEVYEAPEIKLEIVGPHVKIKEANIKVELATSTKDVERGLSGRVTLPKNSGMLFVFPKAHRYSFWMRDMNFPLDIIWINEGTVVDISENVPNNFDPKAPVFYQPKTPAQYVLEVNAGFSDLYDIKTGDAVLFINIDL